jgi:hypothetical protein
MPLKVSDEEFISCWKRLGSPARISEALGIDVRQIYRRRAAIEERHGFILDAADEARSKRPRNHVDRTGHRITLDLPDGVAVIFGDAHYWPGDRSIAHQALIQTIKDLKPDVIICNGDAFDGARISRHPATSWAKMPEVADELAYCQEMLGEIASVAPEKAKLVWNMGNHDTRFSARLAQTAGEYVGVPGTDLPDHFSDWNFAWSTQINDDTKVKHRWHNGVHATWNNTLKSGFNIFTNHIHRLCVTPLTDYRARRYGVDCGTLSDFGPDVDKFIYGEDNPFNWGSGFAVASFQRGKLLPPELAAVQDGVCYFRGQTVNSNLVKVSTKLQSKKAA